MNLLSKAATWQKITFFAILFLALLLRLIGLGEMSFIHDEISALTRTQCTSFWEMLQNGVKINDTHPPLIQVFLYGWTAWFGSSEMVVKAPFILMGLASLIALFMVTKAWTKSINLGLILMAFFATSQLHITYSTVARMYISGLLFCLLLVYYWWRWIQSKGTIRHKSYWYMVVFAVLASYNHHFSLFFALLVWLTGWFFVSKSQKKHYLLSLVLVLVGYLPILGITYYQLFEQKGLSWLAAPSASYLLDFGAYMFHYVGWYALLVLMGFGISIGLKNKISPVSLFGLGWFLVTLMVAYFYSIWVAPVIQYHLLIFAVPFVFIALFEPISAFFKGKKSMMLILGIIAINLYSLVVVRKHFELFPKQAYGQLAKHLAGKNPNETLAITSLRKEYVKFYLQDMKPTPNVYFLEDVKDLSGTQLFSQLDLSSVQEIILSDCPKYIYSQLANRFEESEAPEHSFLNTIQHLKRRPNLNPSNVPISSFGPSKKEWNHIPEWFNDSIYYLMEGAEWGPALNLDTKKLTKQNLHCAAQLKGQQGGEVIFVLSADAENGQNIYLAESINLRSFALENYEVLFPLSGIDQNTTYNNAKLFIWKKYPQACEILSIHVSQGNQQTNQGSDFSEIISTADFNHSELPWTFYESPTQMDIGSGQAYLEIEPQNVFVPGFATAYQKDHSYAFNIDFRTDQLDLKSYIYVALKRGETLVDWRSIPLHYYYTNPKGWNTASVSLDSEFLSDPTCKNCEVQFSCFKAGGAVIQYKNAVVRKYPSNPVYYGSINDF